MRLATIERVAIHVRLTLMFPSRESWLTLTIESTFQTISDAVLEVQVFRSMANTSLGFIRFQ